MAHPVPVQMSDPPTPEELEAQRQWVIDQAIALSAVACTAAGDPVSPSGQEPYPDAPTTPPETRK